MSFFSKFLGLLSDACNPSFFLVLNRISIFRIFSIHGGYWTHLETNLEQIGGGADVYAAADDDDDADAADGDDDDDTNDCENHHGGDYDNADDDMFSAVEHVPT